MTAKAEPVTEPSPGIHENTDGDGPLVPDGGGLPEPVVVPFVAGGETDGDAWTRSCHSSGFELLSE